MVSSNFDFPLSEILYGFKKKRRTLLQSGLATEYTEYTALVLPVQFLPASQIKDHKCAADSTFSIKIYKIFHIGAT